MSARGSTRRRPADPSALRARHRDLSACWPGGCTGRGTASREAHRVGLQAEWEGHPVDHPIVGAGPPSAVVWALGLVEEFLAAGGELHFVEGIPFAVGLPLDEGHPLVVEHLVVVGHPVVVGLPVDAGLPVAVGHPVVVELPLHAVPQAVEGHPTVGNDPAAAEVFEVCAVSVISGASAAAAC